MSDLQAASPLFFERYELKYHVPLDMVEEISAFVEVYCALDPFSEKSHDHYYEINNLYFDTPNFLFRERRVAGIDDRFNVRIRSYGTDPKPPYFFEIKHKVNGIVKKKRAKVYSEEWADALKREDYFYEDGKEPTISTSDDYYQAFLNTVYSYNAEPKVFTTYRRKAYLSLVDDYARVTFDRNLKFMKCEDYTLRPVKMDLCNYDCPNVFSNVHENVILELKCTTRVPMWFIDLISYFNLKRMSFSKYTNAIDEVLHNSFVYRADRESIINL